MISTTRINLELTKCLNTRYSLIQLYIDASIFGYASRMYKCIKDIMILYALEKSLYNAIYYNFDETEVETLISKIREFLGIINYISTVDYFATKYPGILITTESEDGFGDLIIHNTTVYPTAVVYRDDSSDWFSQDLTSLIIANGQTTIAGLGFDISNVDIDALLLEVQGDNPEYTSSGSGYHVVASTLHWHNFYDLKIGMQIKIRWKLI